METNYKHILCEFQQLKDKLETINQNQLDLKKDMQMIFADITHFENLVLKILEHNKVSLKKSEEYHH